MLAADRRHDQFEWWYLQIVSDRALATVTLHITDLLGGRQKGPYLSVGYYSSEDRLTIERHIPVSTATVGPDARLFADGMLVENDTGYELNLSVDGLSLVCTITSVSGISRRHQIDLATDPTTNRSSHWSVWMPFGEVDGYLQVAGRGTVGLSGWAYQDHNWGTLPLYESFKAWGWLAVKRSPTPVIGVGLLPLVGNLRLYKSETSALTNPAGPPGLQEGVLPTQTTSALLDELYRWLSSSDRIRILKIRHYRSGQSRSAVYRRWAVVDEGLTGRFQGVMEVCALTTAPGAGAR